MAKVDVGSNFSGESRGSGRLVKALVDQIDYYQDLRDQCSDLQTVREYEIVLEALRAVAEKGGVAPTPTRQVKDVDVSTEG